MARCASRARGCMNADSTCEGWSCVLRVASAGGRRGKEGREEGGGPEELGAVGARGGDAVRRRRVEAHGGAESKGHFFFPCRGLCDVGGGRERRGVTRWLGGGILDCTSGGGFFGHVFIHSALLHGEEKTGVYLPS